MKNLFRVVYMSTSDCFIHVNSKDLEALVKGGFDETCCVRIEFGENLTQHTYSSLSASGVTNLEADTVGIDTEYAELLNIKENEKVLISTCDAPTLAQVYISPKEDIYYEMIVKNLRHLENSLMDKVNVIAVNQTIPILLYSNVRVLLKIDKLKPDVTYGKLQRRTELIINEDLQAVPPELTSRPEQNVYDVLNKTLSNISVNERETESETKNLVSSPNITPYFTRLLEIVPKLVGSISRGQSSELKAEEVHLNQIFRESKSVRFKVGPSFVYRSDFPEDIRNRCVFSRSFPVQKSTDGDCCYKLFCRIKSVAQYYSDKIQMVLSENTNKYNATFVYVVSLNNSDCDIVFCPDFIMKHFNLKVGSLIELEPVKPYKRSMNEYSFLVSQKKTDAEKVAEPVYADSISKIYKNVIQTVIDNIRLSQKINTLIVGDTGSGKTHLLQSVLKHFTSQFLHCVNIDCKSLGRMKINNIEQEFTVKLTECCKYQPAILFIDDLDSLIVEEEEGNLYNAMYTTCLTNSLISLMSSYQKINDIYYISTGTTLAKFKEFSTNRGPVIFESIHEILDLEPAERALMLKHLMSKPALSYDESVIDDIIYKTKGCNAQDLVDFVSIMTLRTMSKPSGDKKLTKIDFEAALSEYTPLSLYGVNLHKNIPIKWEDIGGMEGTKTMLKEMLSRPVLYEDVYKSCPLRLQCGVLLYGAPGTGKTLIAGAVANECGLNFISINGPEIFSKFLGGSEKGIRDLFQRARKAKPCLLFFDEFESLAPRRGSSKSDVNDRVVNQLLTELDGVEELSGVFILAATSRPDLLDPALLRPGRIDKTVHCTLPNLDERLSILKSLSKRLNMSDDVNLNYIAEKTDGYTGADLQAILYSAQTSMVKEAEKNQLNSKQKLSLNQSHLMNGLSETKPSLSQEDKLTFDLIYNTFVSSRMRGVSERPQNTQQKTMYC